MRNSPVSRLRVRPPLNRKVASGRRAAAASYRARTSTPDTGRPRSSATEPGRKAFGRSAKEGPGAAKGPSKESSKKPVAAARTGPDDPSLRVYAPARSVRTEVEKSRLSQT